MTRKPISDETRENMRKAAIKSWSDPSIRQKHVDGNTKAWEDPETRENYIKGITKSNQLPEVKQRHSDGAKAAYEENPELRTLLSKLATERMKLIKDDPIQYAEFCKNISKTTKEAMKNPEILKTISEKSIEMWKDPDIRKKLIHSLKEAITESWKDPKIRQKRIDGINIAYETTDYREKVSIGTKKALADPAIRKKMSDHQNREDVKQRNRETHLGKSPSPESRKKQSVALTGRPQTPEHISKRIIKITGLKRSPEFCSAVSLRQKGKKLSYDHRMKIGRRGEQSPNWRGGSSYGKYCPKFKPMRPRVRAFFNYTCMMPNCECGNIPQTAKTKPQLDVHHTYYQKEACCYTTESGEFIFDLGKDGKIIVKGNPTKFVTLCKSAHSKVNRNRLYWATFFEELINTKYGGKSYYTEKEYKEYLNRKNKM